MPDKAWRSAVLGVGLLLLGGTSTRWLRTEPMRALLVTDRLAECVAHGDEGDVEFSRGKLESSRARFAGNLAVLLIALGAATLVVAWRESRGATLPRLSVPLLAALFVAGNQAVGQVGLAVGAWRDGLFSESSDERTSRFFDRACEASEVIRRLIPPGESFLLIDFASPQDVNKVDYLVFPRRMFMPPHAYLRLSATRLRQLLESRPDAVEWMSSRGISYAVDLKTLVLEGDESAIVTLPRAE